MFSDGAAGFLPCGGLASHAAISADAAGVSTGYTWARVEWAVCTGCARGSSAPRSALHLPELAREHGRLLGSFCRVLQAVGRAPFLRKRYNLANSSMRLEIYI